MENDNGRYTSPWIEEVEMDPRHAGRHAHGPTKTNMCGWKGCTKFATMSESFYAGECMCEEHQRMVEEVMKATSHLGRFRVSWPGWA